MARNRSDPGELVYVPASSSRASSPSDVSAVSSVCSCIDVTDSLLSRACSASVVSPPELAAMCSKSSMSRAAKSAFEPMKPANAAR